jgi:large subunit ribosomal protein L21
MYAVIKTGGKQYRVDTDAELKIDLISGDVGSQVEFKDVLVVSDDSGTTIGTPVVDKAVVKAEILAHVKDKKVLVFHKRPRKGFKRLRGHRQQYSLIKVKEIKAGG